jgi:hypothetical protein
MMQHSGISCRGNEKVWQQYSSRPILRDAASRALRMRSKYVAPKLDPHGEEARQRRLEP